MRFKLDENLGRLAQELFQEAGHEVHTVHEEGLQGTPDPQVLLACQNEQRCLATLDLDFATPCAFPLSRLRELSFYASETTSDTRTCEPHWDDSSSLPCGNPCRDDC